jgi:hypothetical protein
MTMAKTLVNRVLPKGRGNHSTDATRSVNGRKGRGADAFSGKMTASQRSIDRRVEEIGQRNQALGYISVSFPIHASHEWLKARKL